MLIEETMIFQAKTSSKDGENCYTIITCANRSKDINNLNLKLLKI